MKHLYIILTAFFALGVLSSCDDSMPESNEGIKVEAFAPALSRMDTGNAQTRATNIPGFSVNTDLDPTYEANGKVENRQGWKLDVNFYRGTVPGTATGDKVTGWEYDATAEGWAKTLTPPGDEDLYFPSYKITQTDATLYPVTTSQLPAYTQSTDADLLAQDILATVKKDVIPSKTPLVTLEHKYSMLDFILKDVDNTTILDVTVIDPANASNPYTPYKVPRADNVMEYMVIIPTGVVNPVVRIETREGAVYRPSIKLPKVKPTDTVYPDLTAKANTCYCVELVGPDLILTSIFIFDWIYGEAFSGSYTTTTAYPTFYGKAGETVKLKYSTGLEQDITFNSEGQVTVKPLSRTIVAIVIYGNTITLASPIDLRDMAIDLRAYF